MAVSKKKLRLMSLSLMTCGVVLMLVILYFYSKPTISCPSRPRDLLQETRHYRDKDDDFVDFFNPDSNPYRVKREWKMFLHALQKYEKFHQNKLKQLKSSPRKGDVRTLTWACSQKKCSGLGDQLFRIQYFFLLAMISNRLFTIRWDTGLQQTTQYLLPNKIDWTYFNESIGMCDDTHPCSHHNIFDVTSIWNFRWTKKEVSHFEEVLFSSEQHITVTGLVAVDVDKVSNSTLEEQGRRIANGLERIGVRQILQEKGTDTVHTDSKPLWYTVFHKLGVHHLMEIPETSNGKTHYTNNWIYVSHTIFTFLFGFSQKLLTEVEKYQQSLQLHDEDYLVIHIRTGFLGSKSKEDWMSRFQHEGSKLFSKPEHWKCIIKHGIELRDQKLGRNASIYLSTDSDQVKHLVRRAYDNQRIKFGNLQLVHSGLERGHNRCGVKWTAVNNESHLATWLDFFMLANGKEIVHSESSFSVNAAFLMPIPHSAHSWVFYDHNKGCLTANIAGNTTCIC